MKFLLGALVVMAAFAAPAFAASDVVIIYSADRLHDDKGTWFETQFDAFTKATGVKVQYIEGGSSGVAERVAKEKTNPQADVLVTLPLFIQRAEATRLLQPSSPRPPRRSMAATASISHWSTTFRLSSTTPSSSRSRRRASTTSSIRGSRERSSIRPPTKRATAPL
jgi:ABC-type thiamine transport system substrate-binding protein